MTSTDTWAKSVGTIRAIGTAEKILAAVERRARLATQGKADLAAAKRLAFQGLDCLNASLGESSRGAAILAQIGMVAYGLTRLDRGARHAAASCNGDAPPVCRAVPYGRELAEAMR